MAKRPIDFYKQALEHPNVKAFLRLIRQGESAQTEDAYRWLFGSTKTKPLLFNSWADHPRVKTYEAYDGQFKKNGKIDYTTAAGAYQIIESTWDSTVKSYIGKTDFSPGNQDLAAVALIDYRGALDDVIAGRIGEAIVHCRMEWASLPGSPYGQPTKSMREALDVYEQFGGQFEGYPPTNVPKPVTPATPPKPVDLPPPPPIPEPKKPEPQWTPAGEAPDYGSGPAPPPVPRPAQPTPAPSPEKPMVAPVVGSLLAGLASNLIEMFTPLAREKINKELSRHSDNPEIVSQITNNVIEAAKAVTKKEDPIAAVAEVKADTNALQQVEQNAMASLEAMLPLLDKLHAFETASWSAEELSRNAAADRPGVLVDNDMGVFLMRSGMTAIGMLFLLVGGIIITQLWKNGEADTQSWAALTGLIGWVTAKVGSIYDYRFGSSRTSGAKDVIISKMVDKQARG